MSRIQGLREIVPQLLGQLSPRVRRGVILVFLAPVALVVIASAVRMTVDILTGETPPLELGEAVPPTDGDDDSAAVAPSAEELAPTEGDDVPVVVEDAPELQGI